MTKPFRQIARQTDIHMYKEKDVGESGDPWAAFFQTALKLFLHNLNRMLLVFMEIKYNKV